MDAIGVFVAFIGVDTVTGMNRLTFGSVNLTGGLQLLPVLIGLFAVSQALIDAENFGGTVEEGEVLGGNKIKAEFPKLKQMLEKLENHTFFKRFRLFNRHFAWSWWKYCFICCL